MKILDAYDLTRSLRDAAELAGCSPNTVKRYVDQRAAGGVVEEEAAVRPQLIDEFLPKVEELVERSHGKVRADVTHDKLVAMGYTGSERTTRRAVAQVRAAYRDGRVRVHRPWVPEPGMWLQYDYGQGPLVAGAATVLFCAWLAWSRFRVVLALRDKTLPSVFAALDQTFRLLGGVPTYVLTDNEKTVTSEHIAGIAVRNPQLVAWAGHYAVTVHTCLPADPASKGGSEAAVRVSKADLVPTDANLLPEYQTFADLQKACEAFQVEVNTRPHRITRRPPVQMLAEERARLHPVAAIPYTVAFGTTRTVPPNTPMITFEGGQYSVPHRLPGPDGEAFGGISLLGKTVWVRGYGVGGIGEHVVITYLDPVRGPVEIARHDRTTPGSPRVDDTHFPPAPAGPLDRVPKAKNAAEAAFLELGDGAVLWLREAAVAGTGKMRVKMAQAVELSRLFDPRDVDWALGHAAVHGRFAEADLASVLDHHARHPRPGQPPTARHAGETHSLAQGTTSWARLGQPTIPVTSSPVTSSSVTSSREVGR